MQTEELATLLNNAAHESIDEHGGPKQLLMKMFANVPKAIAFCTWLARVLPVKDDVLYQVSGKLNEKADISGAGPGPIVLHPCQFSFGPDASIKTNPEAAISKSIVDEILQDGFLSMTEPLLVFMTDGAWPQEIPTKLLTTLLASQAGGSIDVMEPFCVGQTKGQTIICSLLLILALVFEDVPNADIEKEQYSNKGNLSLAKLKMEAPLGPMSSSQGCGCLSKIGQSWPVSETKITLSFVRFPFFTPQTRSSHSCSTQCVPSLHTQ